MASITVTKEGLLKLQEELEFLKTVKRKEVTEAIRVARSFGDLSENSEYDEAKTEQAKVEGRIVELEEMLKSVVLIDESGVHTDAVNVGTTVKVFNRTMNMEKVYHLVGSTEANAMQNKISDHSPIGNAIIGAKVGEVVKVETLRGIMELEILEISK
ncbi:MAG: transcription elongation factor GreA [Clostridia bacterium]|nr:transcription elongation factor GreA [Clostridia bacterium]MBQ8235576.1 transcription elongation factor GreA [Clostridia bacterium]MBQ8399511.1 transcription elongation factor GreA [Clostridia bacterium]